MYVCQTLDEASQTCMEWVVLQDYQSIVAFSQDDAYLIGGWLISFFAMCCAYAIIVKSIKLA